MGYKNMYSDFAPVVSQFINLKKVLILLIRNTLGRQRLLLPFSISDRRVDINHFVTIGFYMSVVRYYGEKLLFWAINRIEISLCNSQINLLVSIWMQHLIIAKLYKPRPVFQCNVHITRALDVNFFPWCIAGNWPFSSDRLRCALFGIARIEMNKDTVPARPGFWSMSSWCYRGQSTQCSSLPQFQALVVSCTAQKILLLKLS